MWALVSGVGVFFMGCTMSIAHGITQLQHPHPIEGAPVALAVLLVAGLMESSSLVVAVREVREQARAAGMTFMQYVVDGDDPTAVAVYLEDVAAVGGVVVAASCLGMAHVTGNPTLDAVGSIGVGSIMGCLSVFLVLKNRDQLLGKALQEAQLTAVRDALLADASVVSVHNLRGVIVGTGACRVTAKVNLDPRTVVQSVLSRYSHDEELLRNALAAGLLQLKHGHAHTGAVAASPDAATSGTIDSAAAHVDGLGPDVHAVQAGDGCADADADAGIELYGTSYGAAPLDVHRAGPPGALVLDEVHAGRISAHPVILDHASATELADELLCAYGADMLQGVGYECQRLEGVVRDTLPELETFVHLEVL